MPALLSRSMYALAAGSLERGWNMVEPCYGKLLRSASIKSAACRWQSPTSARSIVLALPAVAVRAERHRVTIGVASNGSPCVCRSHIHKRTVLSAGGGRSSAGLNAIPSPLAGGHWRMIVLFALPHPQGTVDQSRMRREFRPG